MRRLCLVLIASLVAPAAMAADGIDLAKPWGNKDGCINKEQQEVYSENMLLLTKERLTTSASACAVTKIATGKDGSLTLSTLCDMEGEPEQQAATFTVKRGKRRDTLSVFDAEGNLFGEVKRCK